MEITAYSETDGLRRWELLFEDLILVLFTKNAPFPYSAQLLAFSSSNFKLAWKLSPKLGPEQDYISNVWVKSGQLWAGSFSGFSHHINHITGEIIEDRFTK